MNDLKQTIKYWKLKDEALDRTLWRTGFGRGYGPVVRQTARMNEFQRPTSRYPPPPRILPCGLIWKGDNSNRDYVNTSKGLKSQGNWIPLSSASKYVTKIPRVPLNRSRRRQEPLSVPQIYSRSPEARHQNCSNTTNIKYFSRLNTANKH
jgi:hypothetical protein